MSTTSSDDVRASPAGGPLSDAAGSLVEDLTWTGNYFLDDRVVQDLVSGLAPAMRFTKKGPVDSAPLRQEIARYHGIDPEWIHVGAGSSQVLDALFRRHADHEIVDVIPNFHMAHLTARRDGLAYCPLAVRRPEELLPALDAVTRRERALLVLSSPRNPLSYSFSAAQIRAVLAAWPGPVVVDEAYVEFSPVDLVPLLADHAQLILVRTFSKAWGLANLRLGYAMSRRLAGSSFRHQFLLAYNVGELGQRVACALLREPRPVLESIAAARRARQRFLDLLGRLDGCRAWESDANFVCVEAGFIPAALPRLEELGIRISPLHGLRRYAADWPAGARITVPRAEVQDRLLQVFADAAATGSLPPASPS